jgi:CHAT domain-containing protein
MQRRNFVYFEGIGDNSLILAGMHSARCAALLRQMGEPISSQIFLSAMDAFRANYLHSRQKQASLTRMQGDLLNINIQIDSLRMTNAADDDLNMISLLEESFALSEKCALQLLVLESQDSRKSQVYPLTIHALQKQLANNSTQLLLLNSWPDKPEETGYKSITIVESFFIGPDTTDFRIDTLLDSPTDSILGLIKAPEKHEKESYQAFCSWSHDIYHTLFRERDKLINQPNLVIIPYGPIGKIPFDLLLTKLPEVDQQLDFYRGLSYLGLDYHISYATSALSYYQDHQSQSLSLIQEAISFAPSFAVDSNQKGIKLRDMDITRMELVDLPGAARETRYMQEKLGATCITGSQASEYTFKQRASDFQLLHLATHGVAHPLAPLESRIAFSFLSKTADRMNEDGFLLARELFEMDLDNELTLISACESGQGRFAQSEGLLGLSQAFLFAGSKSVVTTYWPVPDETSANLVISFMENLSAGLPKAKALAEAKRAYLNDADSRHAHPFYWAGYSLTGDTRALEFKQDSKIDWFINVLVGIIFLFVLLFSIQRIRKQSQ